MRSERFEIENLRAGLRQRPQQTTFSGARETADHLPFKALRQFAELA